jgi:hypothetical protein
MHPLISVFQKNPLTGAAIAAFPALAVVATLLMLQHRAARRDMGSLAAAAAFLIAVAVTFGAIRGYSYAIWLGMPMVAAMALRLFAALRLKTFVARLAAALALTPLALSSGAITIALAAGLNDRDPFDRPGSRGRIRAQATRRWRSCAGDRRNGREAGDRTCCALTPHSVLPHRSVCRDLSSAHRSPPSRPSRRARSGGEPGRLRHGLRLAARPDGSPPSPSAASAVGSSAPARFRLARAGRQYGRSAFAVYRVKR